MKVAGEMKSVLNETSAVESCTGSVNICMSDSCSEWSGTGLYKCGGWGGDRSPRRKILYGVSQYLWALSMDLA